MKAVIFGIVAATLLAGSASADDKVSVQLD